MNETTEPLRERYQAQLGTEFGAAFHGLRNDWAWGLMRANEFRELFSRAENVALLNAITGGGFTWDIQHILWDDLLLRVCRLTDPSKSAGKHNLTVTRLPPFCKETEPTPFATRCSAAPRRHRGPEGKIRWRNRHLCNINNLFIYNYINIIAKRPS